MSGWPSDSAPPYSQFPSRRSVVYGTKGVIACSQPLAAEAGMEILRKGGNAADAAVAVSAALNVTEPSCCGIGGDAFCLYYEAGSKTVKALNGSGRAPMALNIDYLRSRGLKGNSIPLADLNSVTVPGAAAAWFDTVSKFGSGKVSFLDVMSPSISMAIEGVPVSELHSHAWHRSADLIRNASPDGHTMLLKGRAPRPGEVMRFPDLAQTFIDLALRGKDGFYKGRVAQATVDLIRGHGGVMSMEDFAAHTSTTAEPISYTYGDVTVYECPPNGQGLAALMSLGILDALQKQGKVKPLMAMKHNSVEYLHTLIESLRIAFSDTRYYVTDPDVEHIPMSELLSEGYLSRRAKLFDPARANDAIQHGYPAQSSDTVQFCVTDQWGNALYSKYYAGFGTGAIPKGCGFTLQNRGTGSSLDPNHPNALKPGKRPFHTIIPAIATKKGEFFLAYGVMGGFMQPQGHVQVLLNILRGFSVQASLDAPRFCISAGLPDAEVSKGEENKAGDINAEIYFEEGIDQAVVDELRSQSRELRDYAFAEELLGMGHDGKVVTDFQRGILGRGQIIQRLTNESGRLVWAAGSDPRADGQAIAQI